MDSTRVQQIMSSSEKIDVLFQGDPVWLETLKDNNMVEVTYINSHIKDEVPVYKLVEINK